MIIFLVSGALTGLVLALRRLHNYNLGVHLIKGEPIARPKEINPKADHLSFQVCLRERRTRAGVREW